ncbi:MAG TPA: glycosyltransferase family A protein [Vicinamibacterales bacterium]|nr:glycosyltransferase family A protein [Vicinamibacterales bacterium]
MLFSVVIPAHNRAHLLPQTLDSVRSQSFTDFEVIVVDDGSGDGTARYLDSQPGVKSIRLPRSGAGAARNAGVAAATGDYVAFLDSDDLWMPWTLQAFAGVIAGQRPAIVAGSVIQFSDEREVAAIHDQPIATDQFVDLFASASHAFLIGSGTVAIRRDLLLDAGGFTAPIAYGEDLDLLLRLGDRPCFVRITQPVTLAWRRHADAATARLDDAVAGSRFLIGQELANRYPGGSARAAARREMITRLVRPISLSCLRHGRWRSGADLYRGALGWHVSLHRWRYLAAFPALALVEAMRQPFRRPA